MPVKDILDTMDYGPAPEDDSAAQVWLASHQQRFGLFINGQFSTAGDGFDSRNPANGETLAHITQANAADIDAAVAAPRAAQPAWADLGPHRRARFLYALARQVQKHARMLAVLETLDNGKPIRESRDIDIPLVARHFYHHAGWAQLLDSEFPGYQPLGVVAQVIPWNFPLLMLAWKVAPALAAGNTVVLKPAEYTSLSALRFAEICQDIGLPPGVLNIVTGDGSVGEQLVNHSDVDKVAFTGSTTVGRSIRAATAGSNKKLTLELGGKSPFIVFEDADLDAAVEGLVDAIWFNQGEVCCAGSRLLVQESVADRFHDKLKARMQALRVGNPLDKSIDIGAIADPRQLAQIEARVAAGVAEGAELFQPECLVDPHPSGCFYPPTLLLNVASSFSVAQEEIFGPVLVSMTFRTPAEAAALANNSRYGLAASVWSESVNLSLELAPQLKAGVVWINCGNQFDAAAPFGGVRESGFGREGGKAGMYEYLRPGWEAKLASTPEAELPVAAAATAKQGTPPIDRTPKFYIGGKQQRPDSGYSRKVLADDGQLLGVVGEGNRKDIRNAVEAAAGADGWSRTSGHSRAQVLYYIAENLELRRREFADGLRAAGATASAARREVDVSVSRLFSYAAWADKYDGRTHATPMQGLVITVHEPCGVMGIACPRAFPLLGFISLTAPAIAMGNRVIALPSERFPLAALDFYQVLETSDLPAGVLNIVCGDRDQLACVLADHLGVDALWYHGSAEGAAAVERAAAANLKPTWTFGDRHCDFFKPEQGEGADYLRHATEVKTIWTPYGEQA
ncbi:MAG: aldehyde dehydrogenase family protein [Halieaceae bacterium]|jgi:aldehyde dehydrogenase (NAD+)|nr:aldehyde dehydrogenase family protein [Halieaceae bacterium]